MRVEPYQMLHKLGIYEGTLDSSVLAIGVVSTLVSRVCCIVQ